MTKRKEHPGKRGRHVVDPKAVIDFDVVMRLARLGATHKEIAFVVGIDERTLQRYLNKSPELMSDLKSAKAQADYEVLAAAHKRATGFDYEETTAERRSRPDGTAETVQKVTKKHMAPDPISFIWWMNNRDRLRWPARTTSEIPLPEGFQGIVYVPVLVKRNGMRELPPPPEPEPENT